MGPPTSVTMNCTFALFAVAFVLHAETVPFVGCETTGQVSFPIPQSGPYQVSGLPPEAASKLAYYAYQHQGALIGDGVRAPRGWRCLAWLGSSGSTLIVSPNVVRGWELPAGPAVVARWNAGSGRFQTGEIIARAFPQYRARLKDYATDYGVTYEFKPYPNDHIIRRTPTMVEFQTPANRKGLGNLNGLPVAGGAIDGAAVLQAGEHSFVITLRLPGSDAALKQAILRHAISEASSPSTGSR